MTKNNLAMWIFIAVAAVIAVIILVSVFANNQKVEPLTANPITTETETETESVQDIGVGDAGIAAAPISYASALAKYADRRIQLDKDCHAFPGNITYKDNTGIMIDNRSAKTRTVKVGSNFTIKPWGFKIVVLPDVYLTSKTLLVDCDGSQNVATILVQE